MGLIKPLSHGVPLSGRHHNHAVPRFYNYDRPLAAALTCLCMLYAAVTFVTYKSITVGDILSSNGSPNNNINNNQNRRYLQRSISSGVDEAIIELQHTFPLHVGKDTIVIDHPAIAIIDQHLQNTVVVAQRKELPDDLPRTITVPQFFDESHGYIYNKGNKDPASTIRHYLGDGQTLLTPELAATIGSYYTDPESGTEIETIYCSIASYRDPECQGSVEDLFARADIPDRIRVAIIDQRVPGSDDPICNQPLESCETNPDQSLCKYQHLIDYYELDARLAVGPVFARHLAHRHYRGEYYAMQIDSHVRFTGHWDTDIIGQWKSANNEMGVLSTYLSDIQGSIEPGTYRNIHQGRPIMCASDYEGSGQYKHLRHGQQPEGTPGIRGQPTLHPFWAAGFSFARGHFVIQVPYDQYLPMVFQGEEISIGLRGFSYGYDYYAPERSVCFHMYAIKENESKRKSIPLFWENAEFYTGVGMRAMRRLNSIIGMTGKHQYVPTQEWDPTDTYKYGLGSVRLTSRFFQVFGIHTDTETVEHHLCRFVGKPMMKVFMPALRKNRMGIDYNLIKYEFVDEWKNEEDPGVIKKRRRR